ncbi:hypothetical protein LCGC14_2125290, partial [marine sediment metagenome]
MGRLDACGQEGKNPPSLVPGSV